FDAAKRWPLAVEIRLDLGSGPREAGHHGADRHALDFGDLAIGEAFEHDEQERGALLVDQHRERALDVTAAGFGPPRPGRGGVPEAGAGWWSWIGDSVGRRASDRRRLRLRLVRIV